MPLSQAKPPPTEVRSQNSYCASATPHQTIQAHIGRAGFRSRTRPRSSTIVRSPRYRGAPAVNLLGDHQISQVFEGQARLLVDEGEPFGFVARAERPMAEFEAEVAI